MSDANLTTASGAIGPAKSLIDFVPASGTLINVSRETYNWLIRERIDEGSFERCVQMALGLAYPNDAGMDIQRQIKEADRKIVERVKQLPIRVILSGSIGRLLAKNVDTCYMVSTVAVLTKFHHPQFATDALCSMILDKGGHETAVSLKYNVQRSPVKAVISKIVDSIYLNVVNAGHDLGGLPAELEHLHPHLLDDLTFAGIVMGIERSEQDIVIRSDRFLSDLTLWLLLHFQGRIVVSVDRTVLFEKTLGPCSRVVRIMVKKLCVMAEKFGPNDTNVCDEGSGPVEALLSVGDKLLTFLRGRDDHRPHPSSWTRQALYDVDNLTGDPPLAERSVLNHAERNSIANLAKIMMDWLLSVPVEPVPGADDLQFVPLLRERKRSNMSIGDLLQNHPRLNSLETVDFGPRPEPVVVSRHVGDSIPNAFHERVSLIFKNFPMAQCLLEQVRFRCTCSACQSGLDLDFYKCGCLREGTITRLFVLLAHGICDAFGATNISGYATSRDQATAMVNLLTEVMFFQRVHWDICLSLLLALSPEFP